MFCGAGSLSRVDEDVEPSAPTTPKSSSSSSRKSTKRNNPYSARGLDKFSTVLIELEAKRETIMAKMGCQGSMVRFMYNSSKDWIPILIRAPTPPTKLPNFVDKETTKVVTVDVAESTNPNNPKRRRRWKPYNSCYWPLVVVLLILVCLVMFGKTFAICCTSLGWYLLPTLKNWGGGGRKNKPKKEYGKYGRNY